jgi:hypothetical protein
VAHSAERISNLNNLAKLKQYLKNIVNRGPDRVDWWKMPEEKISRYCPFKGTVTTKICPEVVLYGWIGLRKDMQRWTFKNYPWTSHGPFKFFSNPVWTLTNSHCYWIAMRDVSHSPNSFVPLFQLYISLSDQWELYVIALLTNQNTDWVTLFGFQWCRK